MRKKLLLKNTVLSITFLLLIITGLKSYAQTVSVSGKVLDEKGNPIVGASVQLKEQQKGTLTDGKGVFSISNVSDGHYVLDISYLGFIKQQKAIVVAGGKSPRTDIILKAESQALNEVVVVGYGSQKKKDITSAISTVGVKDVSSRPIVSAVEAITGKAAGVQVASASGAPGSDLSVRIRGIGSPNGGEPLYVVDGVLANDIRAVDPNSIESISILKDASAAGIYGAAGSTNGVVIITTKHGTAGQPRTDIDLYTGMQQVVKKLPMLNNTQWLDLENEINSGTPPTIPDYYNLQTTNNNWQDLVYHHAMQTGVNVGTSGGSDKSVIFLVLVT